MMYSTLPFFVLGFHGCDKTLSEKILSGKKKLKSSKNDYDWLGHGIYFWENDVERALQYAKMLKKHPERCKSQIDNETVIGAIIDLGFCLNLVESRNLQLLKSAYNPFVKTCQKSETPLPQNTPINIEKDLLLRKLDCAVIEFLHETIKHERSFDTIRGVFWEGKELYPNAGFKEKNHIQICVRNPNCIKGYFNPLNLTPGFPIP